MRSKNNRIALVMLLLFSMLTILPFLDQSMYSGTQTKPKEQQEEQPQIPYDLVKFDERTNQNIFIIIGLIGALIFSISVILVNLRKRVEAKKFGKSF